MKIGIHPKYEESVVRCACGNEIKTRSTRKNYHIEICSACHPFFTGKQKLVDSAGRVEKYRRKYGLLTDTDEKTETEATKTEAAQTDS